jgi:hypothetical protein
VGVRTACAASMAGTAALGACWRARPRPMVRSCTFRRARIEQRERQRGGSPVVSPPSSGSHGRGPGMGDGKSTAESLGWS